MHSPADSLPMEVDCQAVKSLLDAGEEFHLLDCRELEEYDVVSIRGATLLPMSELTQRIGELEPQRHRRIVVHCHLGGRSLQVAAWLRQQGFDRAQSLAGGIDRWAQQIEPGMRRY